MKHTQGPWEVRKLIPDRHGIITREGWEIDTPKYSVVAHADHIPPIRNEADARLIAAAPELLEACEDALGIIGAAIGVVPNFQNDLTLAAQTKLLATIAKATGI